MANIGSLNFLNKFFLTIHWRQPCILLVLGYLVLMPGCKPKYTEEELLSMAKWRCEAISLKNARFQLADSLRFAETDTMVNKQKIQKMEEEADVLKTRSLVVADSINTILQHLFETQLTSKNLKDEYLKKVDDLIATMNCK